MSLKPWVLHQSLTEDRLVRVADILRRARDSAAKTARWTLGDTLWSIGCTAYERARYALFQAAKDEYADWLSLDEGDHHLIVKVAMVPLRFYRGFLDHPIPDRYANPTESERVALRLALGLEHLPLHGHFRLEVATTTKGFANGVTFFQVDGDGARQHEWTVPKFMAARKRGKVLPAPVVDSVHEATNSQTGS